MSNKHPHYDSIVAWAEGKTIQVLCSGDHYWYDWKLDDVAPAFCRDNEYRVKPETIRYRTYLLRTVGVSRHYVCTVSEEANKEDPREEWDLFVRWLGDWQEVEI